MRAPQDNDATASAAVYPATVPSDASTRLLVPIPHRVPAPLRGSHLVLVHQNIIADVEGLHRIQNETQLEQMVADHRLVALPAGPALRVDPRLPPNRRYCRPWTADFLADISRQHDALFHRPLQVNSAVRTVAFQRRLERSNGNAAPVTGDTASPHLTGAAVDIAKKGLSMREIAWMREYLGKLQDAGKLDVEEEFQQSCFHVSVYTTYDAPSGRPTVLLAHADAPASAPAVTPHAQRHARKRPRRHHLSAALLAARMR
jgi:hypothetical protein